MNLNDLLSPKAFIIYVIVSLMPLLYGFFSVFTFVFFLISVVGAYLTNFPAKNTIYEKDNVIFPFYGNLIDSAFDEEKNRISFSYKIPFWKVRTSIVFPTYSELVKFEKSENKKTSFDLLFSSNFGEVQIEAKGNFYSEMRFASIGDFGLGGRKVLVLWGNGKLNLTLPKPISDSFDIESYKKAKRGFKLNSFKG